MSSASERTTGGASERTKHVRRGEMHPAKARAVAHGSTAVNARGLWDERVPGPAYRGCSFRSPRRTQIVAHQSPASAAGVAASPTPAYSTCQDPPDPV